MTQQEQPEEHLLATKQDERLSTVKLNERWDTLIGVVLAFAMAIGVWLYAIKPWQAAYLKSTYPEERAAVPVAAQANVMPDVQLERKHLGVPVSQPTVIAAPMLVAPTMGSTAVVPSTMPAAIPEVVAPVVLSAPTTPVVEASVTPPSMPVQPVVVTTPTPAAPPVPEVPVATPIPIVEPATTPAAVVAPVAEITATPQPAPVVVEATPEPLPPNVVIRESIEFAMGQARVPESAQPRLLEIAELLKNDARQLKIVGHTDNIGFTGANRRLSLRRAKAVKAFLVATGVNPDHLGVDGVGESQPIDDNGTEVGRSRNRRIEIVEQ